MIKTVQIHTCTNCNSINIIKNGTDYKGSQKFHGHDCDYYGTLDAKPRYSDEFKEMVIRAYFERMSMEGIKRVFGVHPDTLAKWLKDRGEELPKLEETLDNAPLDDVLELDELWSYVLKKSNKRWVWIALCRRTRQVVAYFVGDRSEDSCRELWKRIPNSYKHCGSFSDFWSAYQKVFNSNTHQSVGKETGETAHVERWNNTLRQRLARFVRKTLSFSKSDFFHDLVLRLFIHHYNLSCSF